jgi:hypothetical protein
LIGLGALFNDQVAVSIANLLEQARPGDTLYSEWPLPEFEDVAKLTAAVDQEVGVTITISLTRTGQIVMTTNMPLPPKQPPGTQP